jgi:hypothetical protein
MKKIEIRKTGPVRLTSAAHPLAGVPAPLVFLDEGAEVTVGRADVDGYVVLPAEGAALLRRLESTAGSVALAFAYMTLLRLAWQFFFYLQTDLYYVVVTVLGCVDLQSTARRVLRARLGRSLAVPAERTRFYSRLRTLRIAHGLTEFLRDYAAAAGGQPRSLVIDHVDEADQTDKELVSVLLRRLDPAPLTLVIGTSGRPGSDPDGPGRGRVMGARAWRGRPRLGSG